MTQPELYDEIALKFPAIWPQLPEWEWVNVHDGKAPNLSLIFLLLERHIDKSDVIIIVHTVPGIAVKLPLENGAAFIGSHLLKYEIQATDSSLTRFISISINGLATVNNS
jgi:hypothetical protein